jgi:hypothetical protein
VPLPVGVKAVFRYENLDAERVEVPASCPSHHLEVNFDSLYQNIRTRCSRRTGGSEELADYSYLGKKR